MEKIVINGGKPLKGEVFVTGAKNAALGIIPAAILAETPSEIENVPDIQDIKNYITMLRKIGATVEQDGNTLRIDPSGIHYDNIVNIEEESRKMRASYYMYGALLSKYRRVMLPLPGGCDLGARPIDMHIKAFEALGAKVEIKNGYLNANAEKLTGADIYFDITSVGATINTMLAAVMAEGTTVLENAAKEPHVVDAANFMNYMGARINGAGTDTIKIRGVKELFGCNYSVVPDQIRAGTYMMAAVATGGDILIKGIIPEHLESVTAKLIEMGSKVIEYDDAIRVIGMKPIKAVNVRTMPHPGFPTDLQQPMGVLMCLAKGTSMITENIFESRFKYVNELTKMGARVTVTNGNVAIFHGGDKLMGARINATDLRAGAAMVIAGLVAEGETIVGGLEHIDRGYEDIVGKYASLGADIKKVNFEE
ncbi:MAG: UDP-N-acetylglucosamine 1-carboxyvinyltransferase [Eubacteriaceae bacterium]|nr:UDP-N-acetylglucosamine 1-carboxyvinyltransferase [Eubacteriaceae bacterium]